MSEIHILIGCHCHFLHRTIEGKIYDGVVKEKKEAQQQYSRAVSRGESAGLIKYWTHTKKKIPFHKMCFYSMFMLGFISISDLLEGL
jgi:hypothetical protein